MTRLSKRPRVNHVEAARMLRSQPGVELVVGEYRSGMSAAGVVRDIQTAHQRHPQNGPSPYAPAGSFTARTVVTDDGVNVIARYVGGAR